MGIALDEARLAAAAGDVPVGAVALRDGEVVGRAHNERELTNDPTAHAEVVLLRKLAAEAGTWRLDDITLVVTLEPCVMCAGALINARIAHLVYGTEDMKAGATASLYNVCADPRLNHEIPVTGRVRQQECAEILETFFAKRRT